MEVATVENSSEETGLTHADTPPGTITRLIFSKAGEIVDSAADGGYQRSTASVMFTEAGSRSQKEARPSTP